MIFPVRESQSNGIEDARFVEFTRTAEDLLRDLYRLNGRAIRSELIETHDF